MACSSKPLLWLRSSAPPPRLVARPTHLRMRRRSIRWSLFRALNYANTCGMVVCALVFATVAHSEQRGLLFLCIIIDTAFQLLDIFYALD